MENHVTLVDHPLVQHKLTIMRDKDTSTNSFRRLLREISQLLAYEITRELGMTTRRIETPMGPMDAPTIGTKKLALISILRAGNGLLDGVFGLLSSLLAVPLLHANFLHHASMPLSWTLDNLFRAIVVSLTLALGGGIYPALRATRLRPITALPSE